jgi:transposase
MHKCVDCFEVLVSANALKQENVTLTSLVTNSRSVVEKLREKAELLEQRLREYENQRDYHLPPAILKTQDPLNYYLSIDLPRSFYEISKDFEYSFSFMLRSGMLPSTAECDSCKSGRGEPLAMVLMPTDTKQFQFVCPNCQHSKLITDGTYWQDAKLPYDKVLMFMFLFALGLKDTSVTRFVRESRYLSQLCKALRHTIAEEFVQTLPKFTGIVEIDESHFYNRPSCDLKAWVFGLYERHTRRTFMQCVPKRDAGNLLPIIMNRCEVGTTIISDQWRAYDKLEDLGYPHYTVDHSRFFVDPQNREIHSQNIEISWGWAKYEIKRKNRTGTALQDYLHEFCWRRSFKAKEKTMEHAEVLKALIQVTIKHPCPKIDIDKLKS